MLYPKCLQCRQILNTKEEIVQGLCSACAQKVQIYYYCAWEDKSISFYRRFWITWKDIVFHPGDFFNRLPRVHDKTSALTFAYLSSAHSFLLLALLLPGGDYFPSLPQLMMGTLTLIGVTTIWLIFVPLILYFSTFIHHLGILLQGKKRKFHQTFRVIGYANALLVLEMLPPVTILAVIWYVVVVMKGLKRVQELSTWQAILAIILVPLSLFILSMIILVSIYNHLSIHMV